jgi:apolipoprotein N-acyltransferase
LKPRSGDSVRRRYPLKTFALNVALLIAATVLFALSHPNALTSRGYPFLAYIAFVPLYVLARRVPLRTSWLWGGVYGVCAYCSFAYWLWSFHPLAIYIIAIAYFLMFLAVFPLLKLADVLFPRRGYIVQWLIWVGFEYLKTLGFNGYSYGIIGYSQWSWVSVIQIASIFGVWGVSALVAFPSCWIAACLNSGRSRHVVFLRSNAIPACMWCAAFASALVFGNLSRVDYSGYNSAKVALIQPNSDPWVGGIAASRRDYETLVRLSDEARAKHPDLSLVVWPETAFVPRIDWHWRYREDPDSFALVSDLLGYLEASNVPFVIGNDDAIVGRNSFGELGRVDYNAALLFRPGVNVLPPNPDRYRKTRLVPFTEHFPYRKTFPWVYDLLVAHDTHFWERGDELTVFRAGDLLFSTPICFEDTFGYISRDFARKGARAIVNMTNDAWAKNEACQFQHLAMSVFRGVENRLPVVRAAASGQTCYIDPNGEIRAMAKPFEAAWLAVSVPLMPKDLVTPYTRYGDWLGVGFAVLAAVSLLAGMLTKIRHLYDN